MFAVLCKRLLTNANTPGVAVNERNPVADDCDEAGQVRRSLDMAMTPYARGQQALATIGVQLLLS